MNVMKDASAVASKITPEDLEAINRWTRRPLKEEEVYTFAVRLCDNEIDREGERFPSDTLYELADLFVGKTGVFDHCWSAHGQAGRIYRTEVVDDGLMETLCGEPYRYLKGYAYMLRTPENAALIADIEGGIKKEVSIGCSVAEARCSICGEEAGTCNHKKGMAYDGEVCCVELFGATDAYEWSFVAVPAQKKAGVIKGLERQSALEKEAAAGRRYLDGLRKETARLLGLQLPCLAGELGRALTRNLEEDELLAVKEACQAELKGSLKGGPQLSYLGETLPVRPDGAFLI